MTRVFLLAMAALLVVVTPAQAGWRLERAQGVAAKVWHDPCGGNVTVVWSEIPAADVALADTERCIVTFRTGRPVRWLRFCTRMIHEYGHLAGYRDPRNLDDPHHSIDPASVMYATEDDSHDARCEHRGRPYLGLSHHSFARTLGRGRGARAP
jgi:hypothetical protein